jgi:PAS domain S-box-containing protein
MKARPLLKYGTAIAISAAGLAVFWLSGELMAPLKANAYVRVAVLVGIAIAIVFLTQSLEGEDKRGSRLDEAHESVERIPGLAWATDVRGQLTAENANCQNYLGAGDTLKTAIHPEDSERALGLWSRSLQTGEDFQSTHRVRDRDRVYRWFRAVANPQRDPTGETIGWIGALIDIDDQKKAERELEARAYQLQQRIDAVPVLLWSARADGFADFLNRRWLEYTGLSPEQAVGFGWLASIHADDRNTLVEYWKSLLEAGTYGEIEARLRRVDGEYRWFLFRAEPLRDASGKVSQWLGSNTDIDDRKKAEEKLRARERELLQFVDAVPAMVCILTPEGEPSYVNKRLMDYVAITKIEDLDVPGHTRLASASRFFVHPDDTDHVQEILSQSFATGEPYTLLHRVRRADGEYRWIEARGEALRDESGRILKWYSVNVDVDDWQKAEEALRKRERELQLLVDTIPTGVWCLTPDGEPDYINKRLETYYGRTVDRSQPVESTRLDRALERLMHPDDLPALQQNLGRSLRTGESFAMRYRNRRADGVYRWVDARAEPLRDEDGRIVRWYGVSVDIDDGVRAQEALRTTREKLSRAAQIANLSQLSGAIAHEVNQPLAAIVTNGQACQRWLSAVPPNVEQAQMSADRIILNSMRATEIISRIRALFKHTTSNKIPIDINEVISEVHHLVIDEISSEGVLVEMDLDPSLPPVFADRVQIQQLLVNMVRNGIDAMLANLGEPKSLTIVSRRDGGNKIRVDIRDNGEGIAEPGRIFEPFFTTKDGGMGIGLAICRSIVESHEGSLWATSNEPRGAVFSFTLPIQTAAAA